jgi:hypothetical protein
MAKYANDLGLDAALDWYSDCNALHICSAQPTSYAEVATYSLGSVAMSAGDFVKSDGATDGRRVTVAQKTISDPTASGTANHVAIVKTTDSTLRRVTTAPDESVTIHIAKNVSSWTFTIRDVT